MSERDVTEEADPEATAPPAAEVTGDAEEDGANATKREGASGKPRATGKSAAKRGANPAKLERGEPVGRYLVLGVLGEGGMGVVYSAYDPELDRKVAIKLLQVSADGDDSQGAEQAWLVREAQALARLAHPNVVNVFDVGQLPGHRVFVAMELVEGKTMREWLEPVKRSWQEVLPVMLEAGAGLAAAHAADLVHRDFKPDNVIVGADGRVRVMDFGLARQHEDGAPAKRTSDLEIETRSPLSDRLTIAGTVVGTPAYMAPEIYAGEPAGPAADQFAFGVALYEALFAQRPYDKHALRTAATDKPSPKVPPTDRGVPASIIRVVMRSISIDPAQRYPSMTALLAELAIDPLAKRRRIGVAIGAVLLVGAATAGGLALSHRGSAVCKGAERRLAGVWDAPVRLTVEKAFGGSKLPYAKKALANVEGALDGYAQQWVAGAVDACTATRVHRDQTEDVLALRDECLDRRLQELRSFARLLSTADDAIVKKVQVGVSELEPIASCANVAALRAPAAPPAEVRAQLPPIFEQLADAHAARLAGKLGAAINGANKAADAAKQLKAVALEAEAHYLVGATQFELRDYEDASTALHDAAWTGVRSRNDPFTARAALLAARIAVEGTNQIAEGGLWLELATATLARIPGDPMLELQRLQVAGIVAVMKGDTTAGFAAHEQALTLAKQLYGSDAPIVAAEEQMVAVTYVKASAMAKALPHFQHAAAIISAEFGPTNPELAAVYSGMGAAYDYTGDKAKARETLDLSISITETSLGKTSPGLIVPLNNVADLLVRSGDGAAALPYAERAKAIAEKTVGSSHPLYHTIATTYGEALAAQGKIADAEKWLDELIEVEAKSKSPFMPTTLSSRAEIALRHNAWADADAIAGRGVATLEASGGKDAPELWRPLAAQGRARVGEGKLAEAVPILERAIAIGEKTQVAAPDLAPARDALAKAKAAP